MRDLVVFLMQDDGIEEDTARFIIDDIMQRYDQDKNRKLDQDEFLAFYEQCLETSEKRQEAEERLRQEHESHEVCDICDSAVPSRSGTPMDSMDMSMDSMSSISVGTSAPSTPRRHLEETRLLDSMYRMRSSGRHGHAAAGGASKPS